MLNSDGSPELVGRNGQIVAGMLVSVQPYSNTHLPGSRVNLFIREEICKNRLMLNWLCFVNLGNIHCILLLN